MRGACGRSSPGPTALPRPNPHLAGPFVLPAQPLRSILPPRARAWCRGGLRDWPRCTPPQGDPLLAVHTQKGFLRGGLLPPPCGRPSPRMPPCEVGPLGNHQRKDGRQPVPKTKPPRPLPAPFPELPGRNAQAPGEKCSSALEKVGPGAGTAGSDLPGTGSAGRPRGRASRPARAPAAAPHTFPAGRVPAPSACALARRATHPVPSRPAVLSSRGKARPSRDRGVPGWSGVQRGGGGT